MKAPGFAGGCLRIALLCVLLFIAHQRQLARRHEFSTIFLDKLSSEEFVDLLKSSAGRRSVERVLGAYKPAAEWITDALRRSVFLLIIGIGMIAMALLLAIGPLLVALPVDLAWMGSLGALASAGIGGTTLVTGALGGEWLPEFDNR